MFFFSFAPSIISASLLSIGHLFFWLCKPHRSTFVIVYKFYLCRDEEMNSITLKSIYWFLRQRVYVENNGAHQTCDDRCGI